MKTSSSLFQGEVPLYRDKTILCFESFRCDKLQYYQRVTRNARGLSEVRKIVLITRSNFKIRCGDVTSTLMNTMTEAAAEAIGYEVRNWTTMGTKYA